eukprot:199_1
MFYRSPGQLPQRPQTKFQKISGKLWHFCVKIKFSCSVWMLLVFGLFVIYLNDNYTNFTISIPNTQLLSRFTSVSSTSSGAIPYLNPNALHGGYGTCPYTTPTYPNIGPDIPVICPSKKAYRIGAAWYLKEDILKHRDKSKDTKDITQFFKVFDTLKGIVDNTTDALDQAVTKKWKRTDGLHLTYSYGACLTERDAKAMHDDWANMVKLKAGYDDILKLYGYDSWTDAKVCFDQVLCMNDNHYGGVTYNLYLDTKSQEMMKRLAAKTEQIQENEYDIALTFKREEQQSFHITLGTISNTKDYDLFDGKKLMDVINKKTMGKFPCIRLTKPPPIENYMCKSTKKLAKGAPKFDWDCNDLVVNVSDET